MHYEQFLEGANPKVLSLVNNIKNGLLILAALSYMLFSSVIAIAIIVIYFLVCALSLGIYVEYEYELTENELDVFKILSKKKRKLVKCIDISKTGRPIDKKDLNLEKYSKAKIVKLYTKNYENSSTQYFIIQESGETKIYEVALNEELLGYVARVRRG
ncbi:MAG: hypothetical protein ACRDA5_09615 [Clostridium sp.]